MNETQNKEYPDNVFTLAIPIVAIDIVIFTIYKNKLCIVLDIKESEDKKVKYILPGGIVKKGVSLEDNISGILLKQTGIQGAYCEQLSVFGDPNRDPRGHVISISYFCMVSVDNFLKNADFTKIQIIDYNNLDSIEIGFHFDHKNIINVAKKRLDYLLEYTDIVKNIVPKEFTIPYLHKVYETILGETIDKRNFRKKLFFLDIIKETGELDRKSANKPSKLYEFIEKRTENIELI
ncbi:MAG: hypothetical protein PHS92_02905 [Candidatus Gracilibacteria bacterium]|nr:hypothetical protein [Candidatus Gracilibacteria bacterium]